MVDGDAIKMTVQIPTYLDWWNVFINEISGGEMIFLFLAIILVAYLGAKFRFPNILFFGIILVFLTIMAFFIDWLIPLIIFPVALLWTWTILKVIKS
jgi:hypothetical protein